MRSVSPTSRSTARRTGEHVETIRRASSAFGYPNRCHADTVRPPMTQDAGSSIECPHRASAPLDPTGRSPPGGPGPAGELRPTHRPFATRESGKRTRRFLRLRRPGDKLSRGAVSGRPFRRPMSRELTLTPTRRRKCLQRAECSLRSAESFGSSSSSSLCLCSLDFSRAADNS